jgi:hypothetical protein
VQFGEDLPMYQLNLPLLFGYTIEAKEILPVASIYVEGYMTSYHILYRLRLENLQFQMLFYFTNKLAACNSVTFELPSSLRKVRVKLRDDFIAVCVRPCASSYLDTEWAKIGGNCS